MSKFVTVAYGLVTREASSVEAYPTLSESEDPWINVDHLLLKPNVGDHTSDEGITFTLDRNSLSTTQAEKLAELRDKCAFHIKQRGFLTGLVLPGQTESVQLVYASKSNDQANLHALSGQALGSSNPDLLLPIMCALGPPTGGQWAQDAVQWQFRDHSIANIKAVMYNLGIHIQGAREFLVDYVGQVLAATTIEAVNAIEWTNPSA